MLTLAKTIASSSLPHICSRSDPVAARPAVEVGSHHRSNTVLALAGPSYPVTPNYVTPGINP